MDAKFCKRINGHHGNHTEILKMTSRPLVANRSKKGGKDQESIQPSTTPVIGYQWERDTVTIRHHNESQEVSPFPAGDLKTSTNIRA